MDYHIQRPPQSAKNWPTGGPHQTARITCYYLVLQYMYRPALKVNWKSPTKAELIYIRSELTKNAIRQVCYYWPPRQAAIKAATTRRGYRRCAICKVEHNHRDCQVDHKSPVMPTDGSQDVHNPDWNVYVSRALALKGWQVLCKPCHKQKTDIENAIRRKNRARLK